MKKLLALFVVVLGFSAVSFAQATKTATASATIIGPISLTKVTDMNFGNIAVGTAAGTVVLAPAGGRTATTVTLPAVTGTVTAATFVVTGEGTSTYAITLPASNVIRIGAAGATMTVNNFTSTPSGTGALTGGTQNIAVGATLNVAASQATGTYVSIAPFDVTVNYN